MPSLEAVNARYPRIGFVVDPVRVAFERGIPIMPMVWAIGGRYCCHIFYCFDLMVLVEGIEQRHTIVIGFVARSPGSGRRG